MKGIIDIFVRYAILIAVALPNFWLFYLIFTPLTIYPIYFLLSLFFETALMGNIILVSKLYPIELIGACIAGAAYYLLLILNLSVPNIKIKKRIKMILISFTALLILNLIRIFTLSLVFISGNPMFDLAHRLFWYIGSTVFVVGIWFAEVKFFKIKEIPFYSDFKNLLRLSKK
jgi:exosortase/archaeosortase family protein